MIKYFIKKYLFYKEADLDLGRKKLSQILSLEVPCEMGSMETQQKKI